MSARAIAALVAQDYTLQDVAAQLGYDLEDVKSIASSPMFKKLVRRMREEGVKGVDHFMAETISYEPDTEYDLSMVKESAEQAWQERRGRKDG